MENGHGWRARFARISWRKAYKQVADWTDVAIPSVVALFSLAGVGAVIGFFLGLCWCSVFPAAPGIPAASPWNADRIGYWSVGGAVAVPLLFIALMIALSVVDARDRRPRIGGLRSRAD